MTLMSCSTAARIVAIDSVSSVPPHIQPPIAQVPIATRDTLSDVPGMLACSIAMSAVSAGWVIIHCLLFEVDCEPIATEALRQLIVENLERGQQLVRCRRKVADASTGRVMNGVHDRCARAANTELADALASERTAMRIVLVQEHDIHLADIGVHCDVIAGQILVDEGPVPRVDVVLLRQSGADAPGHPADHLRARRLGVEDAADRELSEHAPDADLAG